MLNQVIRVGGAMIAFIGIISLPADLHTWWNRLQDVAGMLGDNPVSGVAVLVGILLLCVGYREELTRLLRGGRRWRNDEDLGNEIHGWLRHNNYQLQDMPMDEATTSFNFTAIGPKTNRPVSITKLKHKPGSLRGILLTVGIAIDESHADVVKSMTDDDMEDLSGDLGLELGRFPLPISFNGEDLLNQGIVIQHPMLVSESMTQSQFMERVVRL